MHFAISDFVFVAISVISTVISVISDRVCDFRDFIKIVVISVISFCLYHVIIRKYSD